MNDLDFMKAAVEAFRRGIAAGQTPFGCVILKDGRVVAEPHKTVWSDTEISSQPGLCVLTSDYI